MPLGVSGHRHNTELHEENNNMYLLSCAPDAFCATLHTPVVHVDI